ncbi:MAG TPA: phosphoribosyltransferase family protein [Anaerolineae bacterium]|nr:phosphoribosyltransferase family protein [Anaerolineae bacterium]
MAKRDTYPVRIEGVTRQLPLFAVSPQLSIAVFNLLGDTEIVTAAARGLAKKLAKVDADVLVTAETKSVPLIYHLAIEMNKPWVVLRKDYKPYMGEALSAETLSITTGKPQTLYLDEKDQALLRNKRVILVDDVISTGSTLQGMRLLMDKVGAKVVAAAAVFTEGERAQWQDIYALGHLPLFTGDGKPRVETRKKGSRAKG